MSIFYWHAMDCTVGKLLLTSDGQSLTGIYFQSGRARLPECAAGSADPGPFGAVVEQLQQYFAGERQEFDVPLSATGTAFQRTVWNELRRIPYGTTLSYAELAQRIGNPRACRAVGLANGANPLPIIVPCHRVIGANGSLTGFGGGLPMKQQLLALERRARLPDRVVLPLQLEAWA